MFFQVDKDESTATKSTTADTIDDDINLDDLEL